MKHATQKHYDELLEKNLILEQLLFAIVATNEPRISKAAYEMKKLKGTKDCGYYSFETSEDEFKQYIGIRNNICKALKGRFTQSQVKAIAMHVNRDDYPAQHIIDDTMALLKTGNYELVSP